MFRENAASAYCFQVIVVNNKSFCFHIQSHLHLSCLPWKCAGGGITWLHFCQILVELVYLSISFFDRNEVLFQQMQNQGMISIPSFASTPRPFHKECCSNLSVVHIAWIVLCYQNLIVESDRAVALHRQN